MRSIRSRVKAIERAAETSAENLPTIFIGTSGFSEAEIVGVRDRADAEQARNVQRRPGEPVESLKRRAIAVMPECRGFLFCYRQEAREPIGLTMP